MKIPFALICMASIAVADVEPPLGIPDWPANMQPDQALPAQPGSWPSSATAGYYYIDNTHPSATDTANTYGTPDLPRLTIPGSVTFNQIWIVGGGTDYAISGRTWTVTGNSSTKGTIVGVNNPVLAGSPGASVQLKLAGNWGILHAVGFTECGVNGNSVAHNNWIIRHCTWDGWTGSSTGSMYSPGFRGTGQTTYNEFNICWMNSFTNIGDLEAPTEQDNLAVVATDGTRFFWMVDNQTGKIAGDSIRTGTNVGGGHEPNRASDIYIGRNSMVDNIENGVDVKNSVRTIISENYVSGMLVSVSSTGEAIAIHEQAEYTVVCFNWIQDSNVGVSPSSGGQQHVYIFYNVIRGIFSAGDPDTLQTQGTGVNWSALAGDSVLVGNTFWNNQRDINIEPSSTTAALVIANNLFLGTESTGAHIGFEGGSATLGSANLLISKNLFPAGGASAVVQVTSTQHETLAAAQALSSKFADSIEGDGAVTDAGNGDFSLTASSDAIGAGNNALTFYATLAGIFGTNFEVDRAGNSLLDPPSIGAYEFGSEGGGEDPPPAVDSPQFIRIFGGSLF